MSKPIFVQDIDVRHSPKVRSEMRPEVIVEYAAIFIKEKKQLPPIVLFTNDGKVFLLADGAHRLAAQIKNGAKVVAAEVHKGGFEEALAFALKANERHGIRRSREDKRQCIGEAIKMWPDISNNQIAERCGVDDHTVKSVRDEMEKNAEVQPEPVRKSSDGREQKATKTRKEPAEKPKESSSEIRTESKPVDLQVVEEEKVKDTIGRVIPKFCLPTWNRSGEVKQLMGRIGEVMSELKKANQSSDPLYAGLNITGVLADLDRTWSTIQTAVPYVVCTQCQGHPKTQPKGECRLCKNKGLISKFLWDTAVPTEMKQVLKNQAK